MTLSSTVRSGPVDVPTADGPADAYLSAPDDDGVHPAVLFYMDAFGPRPQLFAMADHLAEHGYVVLVPNVFHRTRRAPLFDNLDELIDPDKRPGLITQVVELIHAYPAEQAVADAGAYLEFLAAHPAVAAGPVGTTGYCMGGALSLRTAAAYPDRVAAAAAFHSGNLATDAADSPHLSVESITAEVYLGHADHDRGMPPEQIARLNSALDEAGVSYREEVYRDALHGFTMADSPIYDPVATDRHWAELFGLLDRTIVAQ